MSTFVSVGNATQPFKRLIDAVMAIAQELPQPVIIQHGNTPAACKGCIVRPFVGMDEFAELVSRAELVILHAGAGSVIHAIRAGKTPVIFPRRATCGEHVDDHQVEFAKALSELGQVVLAEDAGELASAIRTALARQHSPKPGEAGSLMQSLVNEALVEAERAKRSISG